MCSRLYGNCSENLSKAVAGPAKHLCVEHIDPQWLKELLSCWLLALDKNPGVRPIGVGEVLRRIIGKSVIRVPKKDIIDVLGFSQYRGPTHKYANSNLI